MVLMAITIWEEWEVLLIPTIISSNLQSLLIKTILLVYFIIYLETIANGQKFAGSTKKIL
jgi:hypothetical protein